MKTDIEYLKQLETDLEVLAESEAERARTMRAAPARRRGGRADQGKWLRYVGAAAAALTLAWAVGFVAQGNLSGVFDGGSDAAMSAATEAAGGTATAAPPKERAPADAPVFGPVFEESGRSGEHVAAWSLADEQASASPVPGLPTTADPGGNETGGGGQGGAIADNGMAKIVRDGSLGLTIPKGTFETKFDRVFQIATIYGGFVLSSETRGPGSGSVTMRIPADNFDDAIVQVRGLGKVVGSTVNGRDVTAEYVDLQARLDTLEIQRDSFRALLAQTNTIQENITVMNNLTAVQGEIEKIQGRLRYLDDQVAESTLRVDMRERQSQDEEQVQQDENDVDNPSLGRAWDLAVQGTMNVLATAIVGIGYLLPLVIVGLLIFGVVTLVRRRDHGAS